MRALIQGETVGDLIVRGRIGNGGMGEVYLVEDPRLAVLRALKLIALSGPGFNGGPGEAEEYCKRFEREARTLASLRHPHIIGVHAFGELEGNPYLVMTHFPSKDARHWRNEEHPSLLRVVDVGIQLASALEYAHGQQVLHRDIKLSNLLVGADDEAMLIDFGLAKRQLDPELTRAGKTMGTYPYLAPEYMRASDDGTAVHTVLTDLWAVGCVLYALTCGKAAFDQKDELKLVNLIKEGRFEPVKRARPDVPDRWARVIHRLMEPDPAQRLQSAAELVEVLKDDPLGQVAPAARPPPLPTERDTEPNHVRRPVRAVGTSIAAAAIPATAGTAPANPGKSGRNPRTEGVPPIRGTANGTESSLFSHASAASPQSQPRTRTALPQPSFQIPAEPATAARSAARRGLVFPIAAAAFVLLLGGALIVVSERMGGDRRSRSTAYVDPAEVERSARAEREVADIQRERDARTLVTSSTDAHRGSPVPRFPEQSVVEPAAEETAHAKPALRPPRRGVSEPSHSANEDSDPWRQRYGTRTSFNSATAAQGPTPSAAPTTATTPAAAGVKIAVRVKDAIGSTPPGPVIAVVAVPVRVGTIDLPRGAELHGRVTGASGPRVLVDFTVAIVNGRNIQLNGTALGADGRAGVPGRRGFGGASGLAAGASGGAAQALIEAAAGATGNPVAAAAIRGAAPGALDKTTRIDNEEDLVLTDAGARFFVYVEALPG